MRPALWTFCTFLCGTIIGSQAVLAEDFVDFQTPSGNIHCVIFSGFGDGGDGARCDVKDFTASIPMPAPQDCEFDWGNAFWIGSTGQRGGLACISDTVIDPRNAVLDYGQSVSSGGVTCTSAKKGLTCQNSAGHGFLLSRAKQAFF